MDWAVTARTTCRTCATPIADRELETWLAGRPVAPAWTSAPPSCEKRDLAVAAAAAVGFLTAGGNRIGAVVGTAGGIAPLSRPAAAARTCRRCCTPALAAPERRRAADGPRHRRSARRWPAPPRRRGLRRGGLRLPRPRHDVGAARCARSPLRHEVLAVEVVDPRELELPDVGVLALVDPETGADARGRTPPTAKLRERYAEAAAAQRADDRRGVRGGRRRPPALRTDRDWLLDIVRFVGRRATSERRARRPRQRPVDAIPAHRRIARDPASLSPGCCCSWPSSPLLAVVYVRVAAPRGRPTPCASPTSTLLDSVAPKRPGWRRHVAAAVLLLALVALVVASPGPPTSVKVPARAGHRHAGDRRVAVDAGHRRDTRPQLEAAKAAATTSSTSCPPASTSAWSPSPATSSLWSPPPPTTTPSPRDRRPAARRGHRHRRGHLHQPRRHPHRAAGARRPGPARHRPAVRRHHHRPRHRGRPPPGPRSVPVSTIAFGTAEGVVDIGNTGETVPVQVNKATR